MDSCTARRGSTRGTRAWRSRLTSLPMCVTDRVCSTCGRRGSQHDTIEARRFAFVPLGWIKVFFVCRVRRVNCRRCRVHVERVPWAAGKQQLTTTYAWFLAGWAKRLSWREVAVAIGITWDDVYRSVVMAVHWGCAHVDLHGIETNAHRRCASSAAIGGSLSHGRCQEGEARLPPPRPLPHRQGDRSDPKRGGARIASPGAAAPGDHGAVAAAQRARAPDPCRADPIQGSCPP